MSIYNNILLDSGKLDPPYIMVKHISPIQGKPHQNEQPPQKEEYHPNLREHQGYTLEAGSLIDIWA